MWFGNGDGRWSSGLTLMGATGALFVACRLAVDASNLIDREDSGRRALSFWLPVAATTLAAVFMKQGEVAVAIVFGTSVAYLSLVLGMVTYVTPMPGAPSRSGAWPFVLPAALLCLVAGFGGVLTWMDAIMFLVLGLAILGVWQESNRPAAPAVDPAAPEADLAETPAVERERLGWMVPVQLMLSMLIASVGGWFAVRATVATGARVPMAGAVFVAVTVLCPMLILPSLRVSTLAAQQGKIESATNALVATVLLNLCVLLPVIVLLWYPISAIGAQDVASTQPVAAAPFFDASKMAPLPYPMGVWRLETVVLVILGFVLVPVAMGRWIIARQESLLLVGGYIIYLASVIWMMFVTGRFGP